MVAFYSDDLSSNPPEVYNLYAKCLNEIGLRWSIFEKIWKQRYFTNKFMKWRQGLYQWPIYLLFYDQN